MKKSWKKALLAGLSIIMMGSFIAGCGSNNGADNKDVLIVVLDTTKVQIFKQITTT